jgi:hypothetical protein
LSTKEVVSPEFGEDPTKERDMVEDVATKPMLVRAVQVEGASVGASTSMPLTRTRSRCPGLSVLRLCENFTKYVVPICRLVNVWLRMPACWMKAKCVPLAAEFPQGLPTDAVPDLRLLL